MCNWFATTETSYWDYHNILSAKRFIKFVRWDFLRCGASEPYSGNVKMRKKLIEVESDAEFESLMGMPKWEMGSSVRMECQDFGQLQSNRELARKVLLDIGRTYKDLEVFDTKEIYRDEILSGGWYGDYKISHLKIGSWQGIIRLRGFSGPDLYSILGSEERPIIIPEKHLLIGIGKQVFLGKCSTSIFEYDIAEEIKLIGPIYRN